MNERVLLRHRKRILLWIKDQPALSNTREALLTFNQLFILLTTLLILSAIGIFTFIFLAFPPTNNPYPLLAFIVAFIVELILTYEIKGKFLIALDDVFPSYAPSVMANYAPFPPSMLYRQKFFAKKSYYCAVGLNLAIYFGIIVPIMSLLGGSFLFGNVILGVVYFGIPFVCYLHILVLDDSFKHNLSVNIILYNLAGVLLYLAISKFSQIVLWAVIVLYEIPLAAGFYYFLVVLNGASKRWRMNEILKAILLALDEHFQTRDYVVLAEWGWITGHLWVLQSFLQQNPNFTLNENNTKLVKAKASS